MSNGELFATPGQYRRMRGACSGESDHSLVFPIHFIELTTSASEQGASGVDYQCPAHKEPTRITFSSPLPTSLGEVVRRACSGCYHNREVREPQPRPYIEGGG